MSNPDDIERAEGVAGPEETNYKMLISLIRENWIDGLIYGNEYFHRFYTGDKGRSKIKSYSIVGALAVL